jgi:N-acetylneuraminic acid mutarotase
MNKEWTWVSGANTVQASGVYGTQGVASATNVPGARGGAVSWIDSSGNLWLFGGENLATGFSFNDLWEFNPTTREWTWVSGSDTVNAVGVYGTLGVPSPSNVPGGRSSAASWIDSSGNFWLFGGYGYESNGTEGDFNDLWEFNRTTREWTWVSGSDTVNTVGIYGTLGVPSPSNIPGGRDSAVSWIDSSGNLWLFGGNGQLSPIGDYVTELNDLWEFNPVAKTWTWVSGADTVSASSVYGTLGMPAPTNVPGARRGASGWVDGSGNLWLFGGEITAIGNAEFNDLWRYQP